MTGSETLSYDAKCRRRTTNLRFKASDGIWDSSNWFPMNLRNLEELRIVWKSRRSERKDVNSKQTRLAFTNLRDLVGRDQSRNPLAKHVFQWEQLSRRDESRDTTSSNGFLKNVGRKACQGGTKRSAWSIPEPISSVTKCWRRSWNSQRTDLRLVEGRKVAGSLLSFFLFGPEARTYKISTHDPF